MFDDYPVTEPKFRYALVNNKPIPAADTRQKYPFPYMEVGHSFTVPADDPAAKRNGNGGCSVTSSAHGWARRHAQSFRSRRNADDSVTIWRTG